MLYRPVQTSGTLSPRKQYCLGSASKKEQGTNRVRCTLRPGLKGLVVAKFSGLKVTRILTRCKQLSAGKWAGGMIALMPQAVSRCLVASCAIYTTAFNINRTSVTRRSGEPNSPGFRWLPACSRLLHHRPDRQLYASASHRSPALK